MKRRLSVYLDRFQLTSDEQIELDRLQSCMEPLLKKQRAVKKLELYVDFLKLWFDPITVDAKIRRSGDVSYLDRQFDDRLVKHVICYFVEHFEQLKMLIPKEYKHTVHDKVKRKIFEFKVGDSPLNGTWTKTKKNRGDDWSDYGVYIFKNSRGKKVSDFQKIEFKAQKRIKILNSAFIAGLKTSEKEEIEYDVFDDSFYTYCAKTCFELVVRNAMLDDIFVEIFDQNGVLWKVQ